MIDRTIEVSPNCQCRCGMPRTIICLLGLAFMLSSSVRCSKVSNISDLEDGVYSDPARYDGKQVTVRGWVSKISTLGASFGISPGAETLVSEDPLRSTLSEILVTVCDTTGEISVLVMPPTPRLYQTVTVKGVLRALPFPRSVPHYNLLDPFAEAQAESKSPRVLYLAIIRERERR